MLLCEDWKRYLPQITLQSGHLKVQLSKNELPMARFPIKEAEILRLARDMIAGFNERPEDFPKPFVPVEQMERELAEAGQGLAQCEEAEAAARAATADKKRRFKKLTRSMTVNLRCAEFQARKNRFLLHAVGWGPRRPKRPKRAAGEVLELEIVEQLETAVVLRWRKPVDGGRVTAYKIQKRLPGRGGWKDVDTSTSRKAVLHDQERGVELEYRVVAFNQFGDGHPSNTVRAVL